MYDFKDISIITHVRIDTTERERNAYLRHQYYWQNCKNLEFVYVEDDDSMKLPEVIKEKSKYQWLHNPWEFKKTSSYNVGATMTTRKYFIFLDLDCIIHPEHILESVEKLKKNENLGLILPYNGVAIYLSHKTKNKFTTDCDYKVFEDIFPTTFQVNYQNEDLLIGNNQAVGGAVMTTREKFKAFKGFNPNFQGWGFEDNELPARVHKLGFDVVKLASKKQVLWHLPHDGEGASNKEHNPHYRNNNKICSYVEQCTKEELKEYITQW